MDIYQKTARRLLCSRKNLEQVFVEVMKDGESYLVEKRFMEAALLEDADRPEPSRIVLPAGVSL